MNREGSLGLDGEHDAAKGVVLSVWCGGGGIIGDIFGFVRFDGFDFATCIHSTVGNETEMLIKIRNHKHNTYQSYRP